MKLNLCWHDWNKWSQAIESYGGSLHQVRSCKTCGCIKRRQVVSNFTAQLQPRTVNDAIKETDEN